MRDAEHYGFLLIGTVPFGDSAALIFVRQPQREPEDEFGMDFRPISEMPPEIVGKAIRALQGIQGKTDVVEQITPEEMCDSLSKEAIDEMYDKTIAMIGAEG